MLCGNWRAWTCKRAGWTHLTTTYRTGTRLAPGVAGTSRSNIISDDLSRRGGQDRKRINVNQDHELCSWFEKFGVTKEELREAVRAVGDQADRVEQHLKGRKSPQRASNGPSSSTTC